MGAQNTLAPRGPYPQPGGSVPAWHAPREVESAAVAGWMNPRRTATQVATLSPELLAAIRARPVLGEAIGLTAHAARDIIQQLREAAELCRAGRATWSQWNANSLLAKLRTKRRLHRDAIGAARDLAAQMQARRAA